MTDRSAASPFDEILSDLTRRSNVRQVIAAVESSNPPIDWIGTAVAPNSGIERPNPEAPFFMASIDKLFNATIAMLLAEKGSLDLDAPLVDLLPGDAVEGLHVLDGVDYTSKITIRHLLTHTSGLPDWLEDSARGEASLMDQILVQGDRPFSFEQFVNLVSKQLTPHFPPQDPSGRRAKIRYSDTNFILLTRVIERASGQPLHQVHQELLFEPLGLNRTYFPGRSEPLTPTPPALPLLADGAPLEIPHLMGFIRGINTVAGDLIGFLRQLAAGEVFQEPGTRSSMMGAWRRFGVPLDPAALRAPSWPLEYGLGIMRFQLPRLFTSMRRLPPVVGHTGSTGCWLFWCPEYDVYLAGSVNEATAAAVPYRLIPKFLQAIREGRE